MNHALLAIWFTGGLTLLIALKGPGYKPWAAGEFAVLISIVCLLLVAILSKRKMSGVGAITATLTVYMLAQVLLAVDVERALASALLHLKYIWLFIAMAAALQLRAIDFMIRLWVMIAIVVISVGLLKTASSIDTDSLYGLSGFDRQSGIFPNPNMYGSFIAASILLAIGYVGRHQKFLVTVGFSIFFLAAAMALFLTFSRRAWVLAACAAAAMLVLSKKKGNYLNIMALLFLMLAPVLISPDTFLFRASQIFDSRYEANTDRFDQFHAVVDLLGNTSLGFFFGAGAGTVGPAAAYGDAVGQSAVDPYYLVVLGEYGLVGVFLIGCLYFSVAMRGATLFRNASVGFERKKIAAFTVAFLLLSLIGVVGLTPVTFPLSIMQWTIAAFIFVSFEMERNRSSRVSR